MTKAEDVPVYRTDAYKDDDNDERSWCAARRAPHVWVRRFASDPLRGAVGGIGGIGDDIMQGGVEVIGVLRAGHGICYEQRVIGTGENQDMPPSDETLAPYIAAARSAVAQALNEDEAEWERLRAKFGEVRRLVIIRGRAYTLMATCEGYDEDDGRWSAWVVDDEGAAVDIGGGDWEEDTPPNALDAYEGMLRDYLAPRY